MYNTCVGETIGSWNYLFVFFFFMLAISYWWKNNEFVNRRGSDIDFGSFDSFDSKVPVPFGLVPVPGTLGTRRHRNAYAVQRCDRSHGNYFDNTRKPVYSFLVTTTIPGIWSQSGAAIHVFKPYEYKTGNIRAHVHK